MRATAFALLAIAATVAAANPPGGILQVQSPAQQSFGHTWEDSSVTHEPFLLVEEFEQPDRFVLQSHQDDDDPELSKDFAEKTIYEVIESVPQFSKLFKAIKFDKPTAKLLNDSSANVTFFAPGNIALPGKRKPKHGDFLPEEYSFASIIDDLDDAPADDDEKKKKIIKAIVHAILAYHTLPEVHDSTSLSQNSTFPTTFVAKDGSLGGQPSRISVIGPLFHGKGGVINLYAPIRKADIRAKNGVIHVVGRPLFPPFSALEEAFLAPDALSILTSSLQKANLSDAIEWRYIPKGFGLPNKTTAPSVTVFAPVNKAWHKLPKPLQFFLFSPFGERALRKLLQFHIVPDYVLHSEYAYNSSSSKSDFSCMQADNWNQEEMANEVEYLPLISLDHQPMLSHFTGHPMPACSLGPLAPNFAGACCGMTSQPHTGPFAEWSPPSPPEMPDWPHPPAPPPPPKRPDIPKKPMPKLPHPPDMPKPPPPPHMPKPPKEPFPHPPKRPDMPKPPHRLPHHPPPHKKPEVIVNKTIELPTLLSNHTVKVHIVKSAGRFLPPNLSIHMSANHVPVVLRDIVARNGAVHLIARIMDPRGARHKPPHRHDEESDQFVPSHEEYYDWEDWRDWLPQWAAED